MLPDPYFGDQRISVSLDNIKDRVQFQDGTRENLVQVKVIKIPHDGCHPHSYLKHDIDDLT